MQKIALAMSQHKSASLLEIFFYRFARQLDLGCCADVSSHPKAQRRQG